MLTGHDLRGWKFEGDYDRPVGLARRAPGPQRRVPGVEHPGHLDRAVGRVLPGQRIGEGRLASVDARAEEGVAFRGTGTWTGVPLTGGWS